MQTTREGNIGRVFNIGIFDTEIANIGIPVLNIVVYFTYVYSTILYNNV